MATRRNTVIDLSTANGARARNPSRFRQPTGIHHSPPLGAAPSHFSKEEKACWAKIKGEMDWLTEADRCIVELAANLRSRVEKGNAHATMISQYRSVLKELGATPTSRGKVRSAPLDDDNDVPRNHKFS